MSSPEVFALDTERLDVLGRDWLELAARVEGSSYFQTPDWVLAWWETLARQPPTRIATWRGGAGGARAGGRGRGGSARAGRSAAPGSACTGGCPCRFASGRMRAAVRARPTTVAG